MKRKLPQIVEDYYRNSPSWPLPVPTDYMDEVRQFLSDETFPAYSVDDVRAAIESFWVEQISDRNCGL